jgi:hypothetical protein
MHSSSLTMMLTMMPIGMQFLFRIEIGNHSETENLRSSHSSTPYSMLMRNATTSGSAKRTPNSTSMTSWMLIRFPTEKESLIPILTTNDSVKNSPMTTMKPRMKPMSTEMLTLTPSARRIQNWRKTLTPMKNHSPNRSPTLKTKRRRTLTLIARKRSCLIRRESAMTKWIEMSSVMTKGFRIENLSDSSI